jgi:MFS family permease
MPGQHHRMSYRVALSVGEFRAVFMAYVTSSVSLNITMLTLAVLVYERTTSPLLSALTFTLSFLPHLISGTVLGGLIDRWPVRRLLVGGEVVGAAVVLVMVVPGVPTVVLLVLLFCMNLPVPLASGARGALIADILPAEGVVAGRSLLRIVSQAAQIVGYAIGGSLVAWMSVQGALLVAGGTFLCGAVVLFLAIHPRAAQGVPSGSLARDSLRGVREVLALPRVRRVMVFMWMVPFFTVWPEALGPPYVTSLGLPSSVSGWWLVTVSTGTVVSEVVGVFFLPFVRRHVRTLATVAFVPLLVFVGQPGFPYALTLLTAMGLCSAYLLGLDQELLDATPEGKRGRVYSVTSTGLLVTQGAGFALSGALTEVLPPYVVIVVAGVGGLLTVRVLRN